MRKQFVKTIEFLLEKDSRIVLLLGDIGVWEFRKSLENIPERVYNIGILEQSTVSLAAGLALEGMIPIVHTIAPFLVERSYEQLKIDFCYQNLGSNFVSVGASYDYAALGCTHHCPGDVAILKQLPGMEILLPGNSLEFDILFRQAYADGRPSYFRLSERENPEAYDVTFGKATVIKKGKKATVIAVGTMLQVVLASAYDLDVSILYYTTIAPFDGETLKDNLGEAKILLCEPYYYGVLSTDIINAIRPEPVRIEYAGVPHVFLGNYGNIIEQDEFVNITVKHIREKLQKLIYE